MKPAIVEEWKSLNEGYAEWLAKGLRLPYLPLWARTIPYAIERNDPNRPSNALLRRDAILLWADLVGTSGMSFCVDVEPALLTIPAELVAAEKERLAALREAEREMRIRNRGARASQGSFTRHEPIAAR